MHFSARALLLPLAALAAAAGCGGHGEWKEETALSTAALSPSDRAEVERVQQAALSSDAALEWATELATDAGGVRRTRLHF